MAAGLYFQHRFGKTGAIMKATDCGNHRIHMKKYLLSTAVAALGLVGLGVIHVEAATTTNGLPSTFALVGLFSPTNSPVKTTNNIGNVITSTYTSKPLKIATKDILNLLSTEFGTSFPSGSQLAYRLGTSGFLVLDNSGNLVLDVSTNLTDSSYRFSLTNNSGTSAISGKAVQTTTTASTNTVESATDTYSDYAIYYADGKGNNFHFTGVIVLKAGRFCFDEHVIQDTGDCAFRHRRRHVFQPDRRPVPIRARSRKRPGRLPERT